MLNWIIWKIRKLIYKNSLGTNIEIALPEGYLFQSAVGENIVNMPTEEVFTSPRRLEVNGRVYSSKDLIHNNNLIKDFWLEFKNGKVVLYDAKIGKEVLKGIMATDEGASYLGEVALVDYSSPISKTNILFKNTLYDENASCHLALGSGYTKCFPKTLKSDELVNLGCNSSIVHVDFMIGTSDLKIEAETDFGRKLIFKDGNFNL